MRLRVIPTCLSAVVLASGLLVSGCTDPGVAPVTVQPGATEDSPEPVTVQQPTQTVGGTKVGGALNVVAPDVFRPLLPTIMAAFERDNPGVKTAVTFLPSEQVGTQVAAGKVKADVVITGSSTQTGALYGKKLIAEPTIMARSTMILIVPKSNPKKIAAVADLNKAGTRIGLCAADAGCGSPGAELLGQAKVIARTPVRAADATGVIGLVASGKADAGIVGALDARGATNVKLIPVGDQLDNVMITYLVAPMLKTANGGTANALARFLANDDAAAKVFAGAGLLGL